MSTDTVNDFYELVNDLEHNLDLSSCSAAHTPRRANALIHIVVLAASVRQPAAASFA
jgi:hypothetical protein